MPRCFWRAALLSALVPACLDYTPLGVSAPTDGGAEAGTAVSACIACASGEDDAGGCAAEYAQCNALGACRSTIDCVIAQCFDPNANIGPCLAGCEADGGVTASTGPASNAFAAFLQCMSTSCEAACLR
ncbi:MAG TPA: hypothetical protein VE987_03645 [Polyangiaceae bacterium]|nr:hypothetical protein [Polyangiaceae bacterium]